MSIGSGKVGRYVGRFWIIAVVLLLTGCASSSMPPTDISHPTSMRPTERPVLSHTSNGSIFHAQASMASLFEDSRPRYIGDILTVQITENTNATRNLNTTAERKTSNTSSVTAVSPVSKLASLIGANSVLAPSVAAAADNSLTGQGTMGASDVFTGVITVTVIDVYPNGNLLISGEKLVSLGENREFLRLSGVVNPSTISATNTILSTQIADARIEYKGTGTLRDVQEMGWLQKFFLSVLPF